MESSDCKNSLGQTYSLKQAPELVGNNIQNDEESHPAISSALVIPVKINSNNTQCLSQLQCTKIGVLDNNIEQTIEYIDVVHQNLNLIEETGGDINSAEHFISKTCKNDESNSHIRSISMMETQDKSFSELFSSTVNDTALSSSNSTNHKDRQSDLVRESSKSPEISDEDNNRSPQFKRNELINQLIEGPQITLPTSQLPYETVQQCQDSIDNSQTKQSININQSSSQSIKQKNLGELSTTNNESMRPLSTTSSESIQPSEVSTRPSDISSGTPQSSSATIDVKAKIKKTPNDFIFGKVIGEGSYSTVYLAREVSTQREYAIKVCEKMHLIRERKTHIVMREKEVLMKLDHPYFIKLAYTFQDSERLCIHTKYSKTIKKNIELQV